MGDRWVCNWKLEARMCIFGQLSLHRIGTRTTRDVACGQSSLEWAVSYLQLAYFLLEFFLHDQLSFGHACHRTYIQYVLGLWVAVPAPLPPAGMAYWYYVATVCSYRKLPNFESVRVSCLSVMVMHDHWNMWLQQSSANLYRHHMHAFLPLCTCQIRP